MDKRINKVNGSKIVNQFRKEILEVTEPIISKSI